MEQLESTVKLSVCPEHFIKIVYQFMHSVYKVDYTNINALDENLVEELAVRFRNAYGIQASNYLDENNQGCLAFDLMACYNPFEKNKKQYNFAKFNLKKNFVQEEIIGSVYKHYTESLQYNIDLFIQACYLRYQDMPSKYKEKLQRIFHYGLRIQLTSEKDTGYACPQYNFVIEEALLERIRNVANSSVIQNLIAEEKALISFQGEGISNIIAHCNKMNGHKLKNCIENCLAQEFGKSEYISLNDSLIKLLNGECSYDIIRLAVLNLLLTPGLQYLYFIPISYPNQLNTGILTLFATKSIDYEEIKRLKILASNIVNPFVNACVERLASRKVISASLKSAKAAIMSRNMSHNLGSHVMFYIKQKLQSVSKIVDNKVLDNIIPGNIEKIDDIIARIKENKDIELPFLVGLGRFINYLQERQDYIATVATDYIPARSTISFKDFIYDELKPELRYQRHHSDGSSSDAGWQSGNLLLDYIAYSEQYRKSEDIEIRFGQFNGTTPTNDDADNDFKALRKFNIAVPGGVIGRQAIFSIFENIIRNAAKHSGRCADGKMVLELSLLKEENEKFKLDIENLRCKRVDDGNEEKGKDLLDKYIKYKDTYHVLRIKIDMPNKEEDIDNLVSKLGEKYVEADGSMLETSKGLKEMRISAAWLRGYSIDSEIPDDEPPVLSIYREPYEGNDYTLSYILCLPKPRKVAFVLNNKIWEQWKDKDLNKVIKPFGGEVFVVEGINEYYEKKYKENDNIKQADIISDFEIVCMPSDYKNIICPSISSRYIADDGKIEEILTALYNYKDDEQKLKETIRGIYRIWFEATYPNSNSQLVIADEKASKDKETECEILNKGKEDKDRVILKVAAQMNQKPDTSTQKTEDTKENVATKDDCTDNVVYSTHFKGLEFDTTDYGQMLTASTCIEPITGNNSTARLIRQDEWNEEWQYKLLSSGLAKVAIFDERIFSSFVSRTSKRGNTLSVGNIKEMKNTDSSIFKQKLKDEYEIPYDVAEDLYYTDNDNEIKAIIENYNIKYRPEVAQRNHERRIYAFDIREADKETINVVGYNVNIEEHVGQYVNHENDAEIEIAHITYEDKNVKVELTDKGQEVFADSKGEKFDYITIHQGVLDKIYTAFGIKNDEDEKYKVTNALHKCFSKENTPTDVKEFLPNFVIHSGRSKPSNNDMPQKQPFVQFAAVDHAVKDCKYTLVELLATAHYEESNNHN